MLLYIFFAALLGSALSGAIGMGGGILLLAILMLILPMSALVPVHSAVILLMILHRGFLLRHNIQWHILAKCSIGLLIGSYIGSKLYFNLDKNIFSLCLGILLLMLVWLPKIKIGNEKYLFLASFPHGILATLFGTGGIMQAVFSRINLPKRDRVATFASIMSILAMIKLGVFFQAGFDFKPYTNMILIAWVGAFLGNFLGRYLLDKVSEKLFHQLFKGAITLIALKALIEGLWGIFHA